MNKLKKVSAAVLAGTALYAVSGASHGLGFGRPSSRAVLGERLQFQVPLRLESGEDVPSNCLLGDVYLGDDKLPTGSVVLAIQRNAAGEAILKLQTQVALNEPVATVYIVAGCQAKVTRKFVLFVDPPGMVPPTLDAEPLMAQAVGENVLLAATATTPEPHADAPAGRAGAKRVASKGDKGERAANASASARSANGLSLSMGAGDGAAAKGGKGAAVDKPVPGGRLLLDPVEQEATVIPSLRMASALGAGAEADLSSPQVKERRAAAAAMWQAMNASPEQLARDRQRLAELEQRLASLKPASGTTGAAATPESEIVPSWVMGLMAWMLLACFIAIGVMVYKLRKRRTVESQDSWWHGAPPAARAGAAEPTDELGGRTSVEFVHVTTAADPLHDVPAAMVPPAVFKPVPQPVRPSVAPPPITRSTASQTSSLSKPSPSEPLREVSVEELIDLEQQAEFFVVLGQDDAAIDLLEDHVLRTTGASPLPFLKLLEIYQRVGQREDYERVQGEFNQRFNAYAPAWESDLQQGHSLADYPGVVDRLQALWASPARAMDVLEKSLTRPDNDAETFDLPAYRELLFLYAVARDLSERESSDRSSVDLLLPVADTSGVEPIASVHEEANEVEPLMATRPVKAQPQARPSISLDLHLDDLNASTAAYGVGNGAALPIVSGPLAPPPQAEGPLDFEHIDFVDTPPSPHKP